MLSLPLVLICISAPLSCKLPIWRGQTASGDWLIRSTGAKAEVYQNSGGKELVLANGLVSRTFRIVPNVATVGMEEMTKGAELVRAASPEAVVSINGKSYNVGGLYGQPDLAYLTPEWLSSLVTSPNDFKFTGYEIGKSIARMNWKRVRHCEDLPWPPQGIRLTLRFQGPTSADLSKVQVAVSYELYDGCPIFSKSISVKNEGSSTIRLDRFDLENLRMVEAESSVDNSGSWRTPNVTILTDYTFGGAEQNPNNRTVYWDTDPSYGTQVNYDLTTPCVLRIAPPLGPAADIMPHGSFDSFHAYTVVHDGWSRERKGLEIRRAYRILAPWITENPIMLHLTSTDPRTVRNAIDQAADVGFEMVIFSFGSGLNMEDVSAGNIAKFKEFADYAHSKGLEIGGYSLLASRHIDDENDVINPKTGKPGGAIFGYSPCLCSEWGTSYFEHLKTFIAETGFNLLENDGSYPGDVCASTQHPGHRGLDDSQWNQFQVIAGFYRWCRENGVFLNVPDDYMLSGSNKTGMGYRETNWSLPRAQQHIHARQNLYDGTWRKPPTMGWMFVPLVEYQGGGSAATIEPLSEHLDDYREALIDNLAYGAQACYRGPRLYDSPATRKAVQTWVEWYKDHRPILESDVIHLRRADGVHVDGILHVNPNLPEKGLACFWNPSDEPVSEEVNLPLYYTGLIDKAGIVDASAKATEYKLSRDYGVTLRLAIRPHGFQWFVIRS